MGLLLSMLSFMFVLLRIYVSGIVFLNCKGCFKEKAVDSAENGTVALTVDESTKESSTLALISSSEESTSSGKTLEVSDETKSENGREDTAISSLESTVSLSEKTSEIQETSKPVSKELPKRRTKGRYYGNFVSFDFKWR
ncbi:hypothetical protein [Candidatus Mycoplasma haematohominis]|uniref:Uncharacterized protein n=1 Tax=Candidatus Mycoplasma haematohominis TaxID=1494318 RepID=A0A478FR07_9MOLU|nr:hypothetical protein [Candidatus Mycoplasma haemohominis]GCE63923.1 hypothetical protein MHSWG343_09300 [Candidatus Mycoplasma haemohominis]